MMTTWFAATRFNPVPPRAGVRTRAAGESRCGALGVAVVVGFLALFIATCDHRGAAGTGIAQGAFRGGAWGAGVAPEMGAGRGVGVGEGEGEGEGRCKFPTSQ